ncbi:MAG: hypothetical protein R3F11_02315 [Verrucomicrobiales bacterium]
MGRIPPRNRPPHRPYRHARLEIIARRQLKRLGTEKLPAYAAAQAQANPPQFTGNPPKLATGFLALTDPLRQWS